MGKKVNLYMIEQVQKYGRYCFMADVSKIKGNEVTWFECEYAACMSTNTIATYFTDTLYALQHTGSDE